MRSNRRTFLASLGLAGLTSVAGCTSFGDSDEATPSETTPQTSVDPVDDDQYDLAVTHDAENWTEYDPEWKHPVDPPELDVTTETVIEGLKIPWDLAFAPNGDLFITERVGRISRYSADDMETVATPDVIDHADSIAPGEEGGWWEAGSEGGLMGLAVHPNYPDVPLVYAIYTRKDEPAVSGGDDFVNRLSYFDVSADDPGETETVVIDGIPGNEIIHNGARLAFGPENYLWVTTGDAASVNPDLGTDKPLPQDTSSLAGKVLRLKPDGTAPADNPAVGGDPRVYTYGHRNPQGITFMPDTTPVETEHGPSAHDEVNVLEAGENYGWGPKGERARRAETYRGSDYARPVVNTEKTWAPPGAVFYTGDAVPSWQNRLLVGGLSSQRINIVTVYPTDGEPASAGNGGQRFDADWMNADYSAVHHTTLADELGRIRHIEQGPDGALYAVTSNRDGRAKGDQFPREADDRLVRITPA
ncbi:PQQ-dependent sugar dehydrogenase [Halobacterium jilantaiense]|uniref:Glucose/arabinose dehydrogenase, beta-propeller fold n=1 Tax=Halobacterium jilantaiense TaxID=355548 RepID=A0A1I0PC90_9EURY|nr:PQQ-dependent sugar dehydrogenase [Halobacterium jilantaiense]SEW11210.1 Glucose/arabinose dehydrogenase, beta-propeller fold [Halobacterium jilantaiense]